MYKIDVDVTDNNALADCLKNECKQFLNKSFFTINAQANFRDDILHGFGHALRDRLRAVQCPSKMIDQIGGWTSGKIGQGYGEGYGLGQAYNFLIDLC